MEDAEMGPGGDDPESVMKQKAEALASALSSLASAASKLSARSRGIPSNADFHFYNNFSDFKSPTRDITAITAPAMTTISSFPVLRLRNAPFPTNDLDDALDWVVNLNDELLERFGASMDEFKLTRTKEEENEGKGGADENGFQLVLGKNKKKNTKEESTPSSSYSATGVSVATKDKRASGGAKSKVPFHIPSIPRPQDKYRILVNNANLPFQHVWLEKSDDGTRFIHPLEKLSVLEFVDKAVGEGEPMKPPPLESTPFKLVEELKDLKEMVAKLKGATEFAVDLEHNQYRSFQGLTCLMQISTRTEDYIVDTLKLRIYIGSYLRDIFKDPSKRKVMHGADHDILWLQRDFGIYVCNLFDTGQASRLLQLERNSLAFLLHYFCDVNANKEYQNADWRLRPLPAEMVKYAREDTHYLLYIYDLMRLRLISESTKETDLLLEVHKRSDEICLQMYEKELLTDTSFLNIYGVQQAELNARQLAIVAGLYQWRDYIARSEDESTGYILPNKILIEIAKELPLTSDKLLRLLKSRHSYVERNLSSIIDIIRNSFSQSHAFESIALQLKHAQLEKAKAKEAANVDQECHVTQITPSSAHISVGTIHAADAQTVQVVPSVTMSSGNLTATAPSYTPSQTPLMSVRQSQNLGAASLNQTWSPSTVGGTTRTNGSLFNAGTKTASVQIMKKPPAFGALFGKPSSSGKKPGIVITEQEDSKNKLEKIKQAVTLPFNFGGRAKLPPSNSASSNEIMMQSPPAPARFSQPEKMQVQGPISTTTTEDVIPLEVEVEGEEDDEEEESGVKHREWFPRPAVLQTYDTNGQTVEADSDSDADIPTELTSSFEKCFKSINEMRNSQQSQCKPSRSENMASLQLKPFDYSSARKGIQFGEPGKKNNGDKDDDDGNEGGGRKSDQSSVGNNNNKTRRSGSKKERGERGEKEKSFQQPRRRQAFPMSGNRSTTYI